MENVGSRIKNTKRNIVAGLLKQIIVILFPFLIRTIIIYILGAEYQGLNGLFTSILQVLNLTDLGFTTAVTFVMYKPVADNDKKTLCAILAYLRKVYRIIGLVILVIGLAITPFLRFLISGDVPSDINIYILFLIYLFNTVISYFLFAYKSTLFTAVQRADVTSNIYTVVNVIFKSIEVAMLLVFKNYYVYVAILPLSTIVNNILVEVFSRKYFPDILPCGSISEETNKTITKQVKALFVGKLGTVARNSFDNIVLSTLLGLVTVTIYGNYYVIFTALYGIMLVIVSSMQASVGNSIAKENIQKNHQDLMKFTFIFMWIIGWFSICMACLYQPFMIIWMRGDENMLLSTVNMLLFCLYFYLINMNNTRNLYLEGNGLYYECRLWFLLEAIGNLTLNFLLGYFLGVTGILVATIITIFVFNFITRTNVLYKHYFCFLPTQFYLKHFIYFLATIGIGSFAFWLCSIIPYEGWLGLVVRGVICIFMPHIFYFLFYFKMNDFKESVLFLKQTIKKRV